MWPCDGRKLHDGQATLISQLTPQRHARPRGIARGRPLLEHPRKPGGEPTNRQRNCAPACRTRGPSASRLHPHRTSARIAMATLDSWDSWLADQAAAKKAKRSAPSATAESGGGGEGGGTAPAVVDPVAQLDPKSQDEFVKLAVEVEQARRAAQAGKKSGNKGRKKRGRGDDAAAVPSESFAALKQRLLSQSLADAAGSGDGSDSAAAAADGTGEGGGKGEGGAGAKAPSKSKLKRQRKKAAAAKKLKQRMHAGAAAPQSPAAAGGGEGKGKGESAAGAGAGTAKEEVGGEEDKAAATPVEVAVDAMREAGEAYLELWKAQADGAKGSGWKFKKTVQIWLLQHACYPSRLSGTGFKRFLKYLKGLRGKAASTTLKQTEALHTRYSAAATAADPDAAQLLLAGPDANTGGDGSNGNSNKPAKVAGRAEKMLKVLRKICTAQTSKLRLQDKDED